MKKEGKNHDYSITLAQEAFPNIQKYFWLSKSSGVGVRTAPS